MAVLTRGRYRLGALALALGMVAPALLASEASAAPIPDLGPGDSGPDVVQLQTELAAKGFYREDIGGVYGPWTQAAVMALTKELGVSRSTSFSGSLSDDLSAYAGPWIPDRDEPNRLEVNLTKQVMYLVRDHEVEAIFPISSGRSGYQSPPGDYDLFYHRTGYIGGVEGYGEYSPWYFTTGLAVHGYHSVPSYPYSHGCIRTEYWDQDYLESRLTIDSPLHIWHEPPHYDKARLDAVAPAEGSDRLISYDRTTGSLIPLELLAPPGGTPGIVESGVRSDTLKGFDFVLDGKIDATQLLILYDKGPGLFRYLEVTGSISTDVVYEASGSRGWTHIVPGDYDGDGGVDLLFYRATDGLMRFYSVDIDVGLRPMTPAMTGNAGWTHLVTGDYDGDGTDDIMWYRATDGLMRFYTVSGTRFSPMTPVMYGSLNWSMIPSGDFDGDGVDDVLYYRSSDGIYRFYDVGPDGTFSAKTPAKYMSTGWTQVVNATLDDTDGTDLVFYRTGSIAAGRFSPDGLYTIGDVRDAPSDQVLVSIEGS